MPHTHNKQTSHVNVAFFSSLKQILKKRNFWLACFYFTGLFGAILTFTDLFNVTYQATIFQVPRTTAIMLNGMTPLGVAAGGITAGLLVSKFQKNQLTASVFSFITLISMFVILYVRIPHEASYAPWFIIDFIFGFGCGGAMLAFQEIQILLKDAVLRPLANSIILTFAYLFNGLILQPLTGYIIGATEINHSAYYSQAELYFIWLYDNKIHDTWHKFNNGLTVVILMLVICFISSFFFSKVNKK